MTHSAVPDLVTLGETMATFVRDRDGYRLTTAGAESNVAAGMSQLGCRVQWFSRLGDDDLGHAVHEIVSGYGVDARIDWDPDRATGVCIKEMRSGASRMRYYRSTSPARHLDLLDLGRWSSVPRIHLTGVTPALSPADCALVTRLVTDRPGPARLSFDINYRPLLWADADEAAAVLVPLARASDVVFLGEDEALAVLRTDDPSAIADALLVRPDQEVILKRGAGQVSLLTNDGETSEPARTVPVVDLTGAGDAFAAGYLTACVWGWAPQGRLRLGHLLASRVIGVTGDVGPDPDPDEIAELARLVQQSVPHMTGEPSR